MIIVNTDGAMFRFRQPIIKALVSAGHDVITVSDETSYFPSLRDLGARPIKVQFDLHALSPFKNLKLLIRLHGVIKEEKPDLVHCFTHKAVLFGVLAAVWLGVPGRFVTVTGLGVLFSRENIASKIVRGLLMLGYRIIGRFLNKMFFQNPDDLEMFLEKGIVEQDRSVLTNGSGIDVKQYSVPNKAVYLSGRKRASKLLSSKILDNQLVVAFAARGLPYKGINEFYQAAKIVNKVMPNSYRFLHFGLVENQPGCLLSAENIDELSQECGVDYLGHRTDIDEFMVGVDVVVLPSYYREGTPRSLIEALAMGKVVVTTDAPGCRETVIDRWNGYLCEPRDAKSLAARLLEVNAEFVQAAKPRSRRLCLEKYDQRMLVATTFNAYGTVLSQLRNEVDE